MPLRIGVNALYLIPGGVGGTEIYLRSLLASLARLDCVNRYYVFTNSETGPDLAPARPNFSVQRQAVRGACRPARLAWEQTVLPAAAARERLDVLFNPGFTAPIYAPCPTVTVFHDLQHKRHPEYFSRVELPFWRLFLWLAVHVSTGLIAVSAATAADLRRFYRVPEWRLRVVRHGVDAEFFEIASRRNPEPLLLTVSTLHPHKNLDRLLRAFAQFRAVCPGFRLVVAGMRGNYTQQLEQLRSELGLEDAVELTGWIPREELYSLYARASAFIYPSRFEGFGMPVLEAMAAGIPTACSAIAPLDEIARGATLQFEPDETAALCGAMLRLVSDRALASELSTGGPARAAEFTWEAAARATLDALVWAAGRA